MEEEKRDRREKEEKIKICKCGHKNVVDGLQFSVLDIIIIFSVS